MNKKLAKYLAAGVVAKIGMEMYARDGFYERTGYKSDYLRDRFKGYNFKRFLTDCEHIVAWPVVTPLVYMGGKVIEKMSDEEFYQKFPQYKKYKRN